MLTADQRLREVINGGPYDRWQWITMVRLAAGADDRGIVDRPDVLLVADWIGKSEDWALAVLRRLKADGWIRSTLDGRLDIGENLRKGLPPRYTSY